MNHNQPKNSDNPNEKHDQIINVRATHMRWHTSKTHSIMQEIKEKAIKMNKDGWFLLAYLVVIVVMALNIQSILPWSMVETLLRTFR
jgi:hypothetical protein